MLEGADALWAFSLRVYALPEVAEACLSLQDRYGIDVNLLLFCCWAGRALDEADFDMADAAVATWRRDVVEPLRAVRRGLSSVSSESARVVRRHVKDAELAAERVAQSLIVGAVPVLPGPAAPGLSVARYLRRAGVPEEVAAKAVALLDARAKEAG